MGSYQIEPSTTRHSIRRIVNPDQINAITTIVNDLFRQYSWWVIGAIMALFFKNAMENFVSGLAFLFGKDYSIEDEVYIGGTKRAIIIKQTFFKTVFLLTDTNRKLVVPNKEIYSLRCEKVLPPRKETEVVIADTQSVQKSEQELE